MKPDDLEAELERAYPELGRTARVERFAADWEISAQAVWKALRGETARPMVPLEVALRRLGGL